MQLYTPGLSNGTITVKLTYSDNTTKTVEPTDGDYLFSINEVDGVTVTKVEITADNTVAS